MLPGELRIKVAPEVANTSFGATHHSFTAKGRRSDKRSATQGRPENIDYGIPHDRGMKMAVIAWLSLAAPALTLPAAEFQVATNGSDANAGTQGAPFRTIQHAADLARPGDVITVHEGVYRERVNPPRGGASDAKRIVYQAARGEQVAIKGSEVVKNWVRISNDTWKVTLPNRFFGTFNPYRDLIHGDWFDAKGRQHHTGAVYLNGDWLIEAARVEAVLQPAGTVPAGGGAGYLLNMAWFRPGENGGPAGRLPADQYRAKQGPRTAACSEGGQCLGWIEEGAWVKYDGVDFGNHSESVEIHAASPTGGGRIELRLDAPDGELLGTCAVTDTGDWQAWDSFHAAIKPTSGVKTVCLVFLPPAAKAPSNSLWFGAVDQDSTAIWAQFKGVNPNEQFVEINVRKTVFYPDQPGRNFITVRGFTMEQAATPWAPPTAEQIGLVGTHWSKGWLIEGNTVRYSKCCGVALGKYGDAYDNTSADSAEGYVATIQRAQAFRIPWTRENIGHHVVRGNHISNCEQAGMIGSLGCSFSTVTGNVIHDIHVHQLFGGAEMAGIKFHGAIDVVISQNHIYRCGDVSGIWLDWMAQGAQVTGNLLHDNFGSLGDIFLEMQHGPILIANNLLLSPRGSFALNSQGIAAVHNLLTGPITNMRSDTRTTPFHAAHSTAIAGMCAGSHTNDSGDHRFYNNLFVAPASLNAVDNSALPCLAAGNVFTRSAQPSKFDTGALLKPNFDPGLKLTETSKGWLLDLTFDKAWVTEQKRRLVTTALLGEAKVPQAPYENPDGSPVKIDTDYFGKKRNRANPTPGPFENPGTGPLTLRVY